MYFDNTLFINGKNKQFLTFSDINLADYASARLNKGLPKGSPFVFEAKNKKEYSQRISYLSI
ncbi:hypothetical protein EOG74_15935 [Salmonella enterica]|nr:hypothetical protein [Salmonella enterica]